MLHHLYFSCDQRSALLMRHLCFDLPPSCPSNQVVVQRGSLCLPHRRHEYSRTIPALRPAFRLFLPPVDTPDTSIACNGKLVLTIVA